MVEIFKTNIIEKAEADRITKILNQRIPFCKITFDLSDCDKILRIAGEVIMAESVIAILNENNYLCTILD